METAFLEGGWLIQFVLSILCRLMVGKNHNIFLHLLIQSLAGLNYSYSLIVIGRSSIVHIETFHELS